VALTKERGVLPSESADALRTFLAVRGIADEFAPLGGIVSAFSEFYATMPASGLSSSPDGDMLLFQYGVYDWGRGEFFEFDLTRQFTASGNGDDDTISQLHCTTMFEPTPELRAIRPSNTWCYDLAELPAFKNAILASEAYQAALIATPIRREIRWELV
jgi:hypothetical protein